ncbi:SGNH/GDSL hydrolase family protein [Spiroplasma endosymbiont of Virgichneumon dumeticola]|uniref:SGNH/GDSL hydrolase family protein n=1 Tax=Spiroplasma endosymbiont of Virgichneumon dumeticola TaxID=3139323 RepID=UPI0035C8A7CC
MQIVADKLGVKLTPGWKFNDLNLKTHQQVGNNYAVGGAQSSICVDVEGIFINKFDINTQVDALLDQHTVQKNDKIFLEIGGNDIIYAMTKVFNCEQDIIINDAIFNEKTALEKLITKGENHILVANLPDFSTIPMFNKHIAKSSRVKEFVNMFNDKWTVMINSLNEKYNNPIKTYSLFNGMNQAISTFKQNPNHNITDNAVTIDFKGLLKDGTFSPKYNPGVNPDNIDNYFRTSPHIYLWRKQWNWMSSIILFKLKNNVLHI